MRFSIVKGDSYLLASTVVARSGRLAGVSITAIKLSTLQTGRSIELERSIGIFATELRHNSP